MPRDKTTPEDLSGMKRVRLPFHIFDDTKEVKQVLLVQSAFKKLTRAEARAVLALGIMLGENDDLGLHLLLELGKWGRS